MSKYLDKAKLSEYVRYGIERGTALATEWQGRNDAEYWKAVGARTILMSLSLQIEEATFDSEAEKERDELRKRVEELDKQLTYFKCPDCSPTDFEYCSHHLEVRTDTWSGGDGW